ncbi:hypothetical protein LTR53_008186 [Teratosphaeriaceae sp. CCFEE 6253]|nr:hypothetical protein LTR53_008186 [Teratosphaeriaceae sp. CCFEE 6253]
MTEAARLAGLPGYDTAPDVYETLDLADSSSTTNTSLNAASPRSATETDATSSSDGDHEGDEDDDDENGVSRRRLHPQRARTKFGATSGQVKTGGVDMSDRVDGGRRGYKVRRRRRRGSEGERREEGLVERMARLRREIEECRVLAEQQRQADDENGEQAAGGEERAAGEVDALGRLLASMDAPARRDKTGVRDQPRPPAAGDGSTPLPTMNEEPADEQTLSRVADFDTRLAALEQALGISSLDATATDAISTPFMPSLMLLDQQLSALTSASSLAHLETASTRIQKLRREADQIPASPPPAGAPSNDNLNASDANASLDQEDMAKLQHLSTLLPTLQALSPTVPAILTRLRSLRTLHTSAAEAASELGAVERRQAEMDVELQEWREGLGRVEKAVREAGEANGRNGGVIEGWVKELEGRVRAP